MIRVEHLNKTYDRGRNANRVLQDVSFELPETGFVCILGPSGCGKTSLLNAIGGLDRFDSGILATDRVQVRHYGTRKYENERNASFGYIFQNYYLLPEHTVAYNIYLGLHSLKLSHREKLQRIRQALEAVDMGRYIRRKVGELSGGQQQRIAIARALARKPRVIFADEPTGNLDEANTMNICSLLRQISKTSLVVMVTHEERIANFFADRIIRLDAGRISADAELGQRGGLDLGSDKELYAGEFRETKLEENSLDLRLLYQEGAAPVALTVVALKDRIVIKLKDERSVHCGTPQEFPVLQEGKRPVVTLEELDRQEPSPLSFQSGSEERSSAGHGIGLGMMLREARLMAKGSHGAKSVSLRLFLVLLSALVIWSVADFLAVQNMDPRDFVVSDSHVLRMEIGRGTMPDSYHITPDAFYKKLTEYLDGSGLDFDFIPQPATGVSYSASFLPQMEDVTAYIEKFSYVLLDRLDPSLITAGRMPETTGEIVVDRWLLENLIAGDGIIQNVVKDVNYFLGETLYFDRADRHMTIVGISDSNEPSIYMSYTDLSWVCNRTRFMSLGDLRRNYPGQFDDLELADNECALNLPVVGTYYEDAVGNSYAAANFTWTIHSIVELSDPAGVILNDKVFRQYMRTLCRDNYTLYCADKAAMLDFLAKPMPEEWSDALAVEATDLYAKEYEPYLEATSMKVDVRSIVTATVVLISMVMLYLLCRARAQDRIGMMGVYRLLGIPRRKLAGIFSLEALICSLQTALPMVILLWLGVTVMNTLKLDIGLALLLPLSAALGVYGCLLAYHLLVTLLPLIRLLHLPPAQLAAKFDF